MNLWCGHWFSCRPYITERTFRVARKNWPKSCPLEYRPFYCRRSVDDIFVLFNSSEHLKPFQSLLNSGHANISFPTKNEKDSKSFYSNS